MLLCALFSAPAARAASLTLHLDAPLCHAVTPEGGAAPTRYRCTGAPSGYQQGTLWLRAPLKAPPRSGLILLVRQSRFARLEVRFGYADGAVIDAGSVRAGDYGLLWMVGGQIAFAAPARAAPIRSVTLAFDRLASVDLFRGRLLAPDTAERQSALLSAVVGGALTLLLLGAFYSTSLGIGTRRPFLGWHAAWAFTVFVWGVLWSQLPLMVLPGIAGTHAAELCTLLAVLSIFFATACAMSSIANRLNPWIRHSVLWLGALVALVGAWAATVTDSHIEICEVLLTILVVADLAAVMVCIFTAWAQGSDEARDFALAWAPPMLVLGTTQCIHVDGGLFGGGSQIMVLIASALQTVWLAIAATLRLSRLRVERDHARRAQQELGELAERDPLTALLNRRGFIARAEAALESGDGFALLLIDLDHFKRVNDKFGHDAGDVALQAVAACLQHWEQGGAFAGRLGGEEFVLGVSARSGAALVGLAEAVRQGIAECHLPPPLPEAVRITASIGLAASAPGLDFASLYKAADLALYEAKRQGRNRIAGRPMTTVPEPARRLAI